MKSAISAKNANVHITHSMKTQVTTVECLLNNCRQSWPIASDLLAWGMTLQQGSLFHLTAAGKSCAFVLTGQLTMALNLANHGLMFTLYNDPSFPHMKPLGLKGCTLCPAMPPPASLHCCGSFDLKAIID